MCLHLLYTTFTPTIVYLFLPLEVWRPNRIVGHLKAASLATLPALATLVALAALAALVSNVFVFDLHNFHSYYCLLDFGSGGLWRPNRITGHLKARSLSVLAAITTLAALVSNVLIFALPNFHPYYCLLDLPLEACGGQIAL